MLTMCSDELFKAPTVVSIFIFEAICAPSCGLSQLLLHTSLHTSFGICCIFVVV